MAESLGEKLRLAREARGITISEVAAQTRIAGRYLEAIEEDNYKPLPGGVFNKGFIKSYAKYVGVDEQEALDDYNRLMGNQAPPDMDEPLPRRARVMTDDRNRSSISSLIFAVVILVLMSGGIYALVQWYRSAPVEPAKSPAANTNTNSNTVAVNPVPTPAVDTTQIKAEIKSINVEKPADAPNVTTIVDGGKKESGNLLPDAPRSITAQNSLEVSYSKYQAAKIQLTLNGKAITLPAAPLKPSAQAITFTITKDTLAQILTSGAITLGETPAANTAGNTTVPTTDANTAPAATPVTAPAATPKPATPKPATPTPAKSPTANVANKVTITIPPRPTPNAKPATPKP
jgi:cytoskeletal protein RodZ